MRVRSIKMRSKTIALFLALGMAASVTACGATDEGTEGGEADSIEQTTPTTEGGEGGEGGARVENVEDDIGY